jgi:glucokinase
VSRACLAVAGPVERRVAQLTNASWRIDADALSAHLAIPDVVLRNDFEAAAAGLDDVDPALCTTLQQGEFSAALPRVVIGAGTGLGVAYLIPGRSGPRIVAGEGGHAGFAPADARQIELLRFVLRETPRVSAEHLLSGAGLVRLYAFVSGDMPADVRERGAPAVAARFDSGEPAAAEAVQLFASILGAVAGDHALAVLATGGVYIAGGIAPRFAGVLAQGSFVAGFGAKGRQAALMARIPVRLIGDSRLGLLGAARLALEA